MLIEVGREKGGYSAGVRPEPVRSRGETNPIINLPLPFITPKGLP